MGSNQSGTKGHGGKRAGAGRPVGTGSPHVLGHGERAAVKAAGLRVPKDAPESYRELADEALGTLVDVMRGGVHFTEAGPRLKAATRIREEVCGPLAQKVEHSGKDGAPLGFVINLGEPKK